MDKVRIQTITPDDVNPRVKGVVHTGQEIIEQVNSWTCRVTGLPIRFLRFELERGKKLRKLIVAELPSGEEWKIRVEHWIDGRRPSVLFMDRHIIEREVEQFGGTEITFFKNYKSDNYIRFVLPEGRVYTCSVTHWREGKRPGGCVGGYCETFFDRRPEMMYTSGLLYYLKFSHPELPPFYKVGITAKDSAQARFGKRDGDYTVTVIDQHPTSMYHCFSLEQDLLKTFAHHRYVPDPPLKGCGNTECFSVDLLGMDPDSEDYHWLNASTITQGVC